MHGEAYFRSLFPRNEIVLGSGFSGTDTVLLEFGNVRLAGRYPSGQRGQTVNLLPYGFQGSNPCLPTNRACSAVSDR